MTTFPVLPTIGPGAGSDGPENMEWLPPPERRRDLPRRPARIWSGSRGRQAVVLPLDVAACSTGQQTYLNAMCLERPVLDTDTPGVRDHVEDGVTGVVVPLARRRPLRTAAGPRPSRRGRR